MGKDENPTKYVLYSEISYDNHHYGYKNHDRNLIINQPMGKPRKTQMEASNHTSPSTKDDTN